MPNKYLNYSKIDTLNFCRKRARVGEKEGEREGKRQRAGKSEKGRARKMVLKSKDNLKIGKKL